MNQQRFRKSLRKGRRMTRKGSNGHLGGISREQSTVLSALKMDDIGQKQGTREVIHAFVEPSMSRNLYMTSFGVEPKQVASGVREETEKNTLDRIGEEFC